MRGRTVPLVVTSGEPAGIGPDLCLQLADHQGPQALVVLADRDILSERAKLLGFPIQIRDYRPGDDESPPPHTLTVLHVPVAHPVRAGILNPANSPYVLSLLDRAITGCQSGEFAAMVTAPVHKGVINQAGIPFTGHTEYLAEKTGTPLVVMMLAGDTTHGPLRVALATTHLPLRAVPDALTPTLLHQVLTILHAEMRHKYGLDKPRILVTGLNPHAGEGGYLGREEIDVITPVVEALRQEGMNLIGPLPADTLFTPPNLARGDVVLAMYHDQGLTALKYATFGHGINITLGLPLIRTSVDHGTALELAGRGQAHMGSLLEAVAQAELMARQKDPI